MTQKAVLDLVPHKQMARKNRTLLNQAQSLEYCTQIDTLLSRLPPTDRLGHLHRVCTSSMLLRAIITLEPLLAF